MKREKIKTIFCHMAVITICMGVFCHGYINGVSLSGNDRFYSYAEDSAVTDDDVVESFKAYCRSRNLIIDSSVTGATLSFVGHVIRQNMNKIGIDMDTIQAQLSKETGGNYGVRWALTATGMNIYNRLFAELLQREDLSVGDSNVNKKAYQGYSASGYLIYIVNCQRSQAYSDYRPYIQQTGSPLINTDTIVSYLFTQDPDYDFSDASISKAVNFSLYATVLGDSHMFQYTTGNKSTWSPYLPYLGTNGMSSGANKYASVIYSNNNGHIARGFPAIVKYTDALYKANVTYLDTGEVVIKPLASLGRPITDCEPTDVDITTPDDKDILPAPPDDDTIINPDGTTDGGGGGGNDNPDQPGGDPDNWNPTIPTIPSPSSPDFPSVDLPDIDIPDLPSLNFSLGDLRNKFPFSLPFDIIAVLNVLDGEPQAPVIDATIPIGSWYTWEFHADFSEFDNYARIFRAFEFIGFVIGLAVFTVHFAKG